MDLELHTLWLVIIKQNLKQFYLERMLIIPEQLNPSPTVNGGRHVQLKFSLSKPSLSQRALTSQGSLRQGSGTVGMMYCHGQQMDE